MDFDGLIETGEQSWLEHLSEGPAWVWALLVPWVSQEQGENRWVDQSKLIPSPQPQTQAQSQYEDSSHHLERRNYQVVTRKSWNCKFTIFIFGDCEAVNENCKIRRENCYGFCFLRIVFVLTWAFRVTGMEIVQFLNVLKDKYDTYNIGVSFPCQI